MRSFPSAVVLPLLLSWSVATPLLAQSTEGWYELGGSATGTGVSGSPENRSYNCDVAVDDNGFPVLAWVDYASDSLSVHVKRWNGSAWIELGGSASGPGISGAYNNIGFSPQVEVDRAGNPIVCWHHELYWGGEIFLKTFVDGAWIGLGGSDEAGGVSQSGNTALEPAMTLDAAGRPVVAWGTTTNQIRLRRWNGSDWADVGEAFPSLQIPRTPAVAIDSLDRPWICWTARSYAAGEVLLRRWDPATASWIGESGSESGGGISGLMQSFGSSMSIDLDDRPTVAWCRAIEGPAIHARMLSAGAWIELDGSATGTGLGPTPGIYRPSLAAGWDGHPLVTLPGPYGETGLPVRLARWDGQGWTGISGSEGETGISGGETFNLNPAVAVGRRGQVAVAWVASTIDTLEIHVKVHDFPALTGLGQFRPDGITPIALGGVAVDNAVVLKGTLRTPQPGLRARLEIELQRLGTPFNNNLPTAVSAFVASGSTVSIPITGLSPGSYRWQARLRGENAEPDSWKDYGGNGEASPDWIVESAGTSPGGGGGGGGSTGGGCSGAAVAGGGGSIAYLLCVGFAWFRRQQSGQTVGKV